MTKKELINLLLIIGTVYLLFSFGIWDINPQNWEMAARVMFSFTTAVTIIMYTLHINNNDD